MAGATVRVQGIAEVNRAFRQIDRALATAFGNDLKTAAAPVVATAKNKISRFQGASLSTIRAKRAGPRVFVEQSARKVTGKHPQFGLEQYGDLVEALDERAAEVVTEVEHVLNRYASHAGF